MKTQLGLMAVAVLTLVWIHSLVAQEIVFTNRIATFTNLQGRAYTGVWLVKGDLDGVIWREAEGAGGGRVSYTNLNAALLDSWGIPTNRIETAKIRAGQKAVKDAQYRAFLEKAARGDPAKAAAFYAEIERQRKAQEAARARAQAAMDRKQEIQALEDAQRELDRQRALAADINNAGGSVFVPDENRRQQEINERLRQLREN